MAESSTQAEPVFHDIKPLPEFHPIPNYVFYCAALALLSLLGFLLIKLLSRKGKEPSLPALEPWPQLLADLRLLESHLTKGEASVRDFSSRLSIAIRCYLERTLNFPAREHTKPEMSQKLYPAMKTALPTLPRDYLQAESLRLTNLLGVLEQITFAPESTETYRPDSPKLIETLRETHIILEDINISLEREKARNLSVREV